ncbi:A-kinase anchor protein 200-like [Belonocnema kinseyi]|uniref:A-kinase anchor protein 200-like n=1 Tax=Belonocnema kinseyi TaxID=2817044 RepID=UPI00143D6210|nr:A-kinase anchor protein 200-like [Belonocnema kinseyi]
MGARQSKRSVDITTTPKKEGLPAEGGVGDAAAPGDGKLERIEETDTKPTTNGITPHTETVEEKKDEATEKEEVKSEETKAEPTVEAPTEAAEVTTPTEETSASPNTTTSPESKETKKKDKTRRHKFSFRTFSFGKKDKTKPAREDTPKNGDVAKEEPLVEGGEEAENAACSPVEKSEVSSPVESEAAVPAQATEAKEVEPAASPAKEKKEETNPVVEKEKPAEKVEAVIAEKVEVSAGARPPTGSQFVEVNASHTKPIATPSIIERKTSEDLPSRFPSSPPPTPIDPSPLQQAQQAAASATALAEALKLPAEAASKETPISLSSSSQSFEDHTSHFSKGSVAPLESQSEIESLIENSKSSENNLPESAVVQESPEEVEKQDLGNGDTDLVILTEEGPIPFHAKPTEVHSEENEQPKTEKEVEVLLEAVEGRMKEDLFSSTTVSEQIFAAGEYAQVSILECKRPEPNATLSEPAVTSRKDSEHEEEIPPPLPVSPAPVVQEVSKILSFVNAEVPPTLVATIELTEPVQESISCPLPMTKLENIEESLSATLSEESVLEKSIPEEPLPEAPLPEERLSEVALPEERLPKIPLPEESLPEEPLPEIALPEIALPEESLPEERLPEVPLPEEPLSESLPEISAGLETSITEPTNAADSAKMIESKSDDVSDSLDDLPPVPQELATCEEDSSDYPLPPDDLSIQSLPAESQESRIPVESLLTPPSSPSPASVSVTTTTATTRECSETHLFDDQSNREFKVESVTQSLNSFNDSESEPEVKERLTESESLTSQLTNGHHITSEDHQSTPEPEAPVENNVSANEVSTTESAVDDAPKSPPPAVPVEVSVSPAPAPVITEDVASVTKVIEEIDISEKAVAAAVKEAIENSNANEIVVDSNHQNHMNE